MLNEEKFYEAMNNMFVGSKIDWKGHWFDDNDFEWMKV